MKFGKSIGSQQEGDSELHYIDYKALKKSIKDVVELLQTNGLAEALTANHAFEEDLAREIRQVNDCFGGRQRELMDEIAHFADAIQVDHAVAEAGSPLRQDGPFKRLVGILGDVDRLRKYAVWNAVAVVKILKKRRKQTNFGLEDVAAERAGWLSRQSFFSGSDFAALHSAIESLGHLLVRSELAQSSSSAACAVVPYKEQKCEQCPICLETISDMVELSCSHRFCWKCFVLGPIAHQPGEYRITQCPICREETSAPNLAEGIGMPTSEGILTRFLHTYFPKEGLEGVGKAQIEAHRQGEEYGREMRDVVGELVKALLGDSQWEPPACGAGQSCSSACMSRDFFHTLPAKQSKTDRDLIGNAQKLQWLQLASSNDPLALDNAAICSLCSEPLLMEAVATTPCKHHFHRVCVVRVDMPECPLCREPLPFSWFLQPEHPCYERGFRAVPSHAYRPAFPGGPSKGTAGYPLQRPPPIDLHGPSGTRMRSYLHCILPTSVGGDDGDDGEGALSGISTMPPDEGVESESEVSSAASSSSEEEDGSASEVDDEVPTAAKVLSITRSHQFAYSALGKMRLADRGNGEFSFPPPPFPLALPAGGSAGTPPPETSSAMPQVLLIEQHV